MSIKNLPTITLILFISTIFYSLTVNYMISGTLLGKVRITDLEPYGGFTLEHLLSGELWRVFVAPLIHTKQLHMFYNALSLLALGILFERRLGSFRFLLIWFIAGSVGTFLSTFTVESPWNLGTGASQGVIGIAGAGLAMFVLNIHRSRIFMGILVLTLVPAIILDLIFSSNHLPKLGHVVSFALGVILFFTIHTSDKHSKRKRVT